MIKRIKKWLSKRPDIEDQLTYESIIDKVLKEGTQASVVECCHNCVYKELNNDEVYCTWYDNYCHEVVNRCVRDSDVTIIWKGAFRSIDECVTCFQNVPGCQERDAVSYCGMTPEIADKFMTAVKEGKTIDCNDYCFKLVEDGKVHKLDKDNNDIVLIHNNVRGWWEYIKCCHDVLAIEGKRTETFDATCPHCHREGEYKITVIRHERDSTPEYFQCKFCGKDMKEWI
ncbi:MAG: hypothetical protein KAR40_06200 [Candidatus Sabulitectum sp.]|nr:hypothetical protein [Candidatus Sabulitectum sp.]